MKLPVGSKLMMHPIEFATAFKGHQFQIEVTLPGSREVAHQIVMVTGEVDDMACKVELVVMG